jgi:F0F1-type ATP synthase epsilon subunit
MSEAEHIFRCVIISPAGKLLDCPTTSVIFTAHDGSVGVLYNHMPMLCELGLGTIEVKSPAGGQERTDDGSSHNKFAFIDGGFALVCSNLVKITASDAVCGWDTNREKIEHLLEKTQKNLGRLSVAAPRYLHEKRKNAILKKILELSLPKGI